MLQTFWRHPRRTEKEPARRLKKDMYIPDQEVHQRNKPGNRRTLRELELFRGCQDRSERIEAIGYRQRFTRTHREDAGEIFPFQGLTRFIFFHFYAWTQLPGNLRIFSFRGMKTISFMLLYPQSIASLIPFPAITMGDTFSSVGTRQLMIAGPGLARASGRPLITSSSVLKV